MVRSDCKMRNFRFYRIVKFMKKRIYTISVFCSPHSVFCYRRHSEGGESRPKNPLKFDGVESTNLLFCEFDDSTISNFGGFFASLTLRSE